MLSTEGLFRNLSGLAKALAERPAEGTEAELAGAMEAVDHINLVAWRYFVQRLPYEGHTVMQKVRHSAPRCYYCALACTRVG